MMSKLGSGYSLRSRIYDKLRNDILNGVYEPGDSLIEMKLAEELGVSRTPVREAIRQLELEGLVKSIPNKGVVVEGVTEQDINDIYEIRKLIEGLAARWATEKMTKDKLKDLKDTLDLMEFYTLKGETDKISVMDTKFHDIIFQACDSKPLRSVLTNLHHFIQRARLVSIGVSGRAQNALKEHQKIYEAIYNKDANAAEKAVQKHIQIAGENIYPYLKKHEIYKTEEDKD